MLAEAGLVVQLLYRVPVVEAVVSSPVLVAQKVEVVVLVVLVETLVQTLQLVEPDNTVEAAEAGVQLVVTENQHSTQTVPDFLTHTPLAALAARL